jgi:aspartate/methionine/tyrosine aminotransferase
MGGCVGWVQIIDKEIDVESFCSNLLHSYGVLLMPSSKYHDSSNSFRIGFGRKNMAEALSIVEKHVKKINRKM